MNTNEIDINKITRQVLIWLHEKDPDSKFGFSWSPESKCPGDGYINEKRFLCPHGGMFPHDISPPPWSDELMGKAIKLLLNHEDPSLDAAYWVSFDPDTSTDPVSIICQIENTMMGLPSFGIDSEPHNAMLKAIHMLITKKKNEHSNSKI